MSKEGETLEITDFTINDPELDAIAAKIRPLPANIVPTEQFIAALRLRILQLPEQRPNSDSRAA